MVGRCLQTAKRLSLDDAICLSVRRAEESPTGTKAANAHSIPCPRANKEQPLATTVSHVRLPRRPKKVRECLLNGSQAGEDWVWIRVHKTMWFDALERRRGDIACFEALAQKTWSGARRKCLTHRYRFARITSAQNRMFLGCGSE
jgi:hypothetical protein